MFELIFDDCLKAMTRLEAESFDLVITSPPFNLANTTGGGNTGMWKTPLLNGYADGHDDCMPHHDYVSWQRNVLSACWRVLKPSGAIFYNHKCRVQAGRLMMPLELIPDEVILRQIVIWDRKCGFNHSPTFYVPNHEWIMILAKPDFRLISKSVSCMGDVWTFSFDRNNPHPASFPPELPQRILDTAPAKRVLDPFAGSATVGVECIRRNIDFVGIENSERYHRMAKRRLELAELGNFDLWATEFNAACQSVYNTPSIESMFT